MHKHFRFEKKNDSSQITLCLEKSNPLFLRALLKLDFLLAPSLDSSFSKVYFLGSSICTLEEFCKGVGVGGISYNIVSRLIWCLVQQNVLLEKSGVSFFSLSLEDIVVVDEWNFFCANPTLCRTIFCEKVKRERESMIIFNSPFLRNKFSSPELLALTNIPSSVSVKTFYYSLACLAFYCLFKKYYSYDSSDSSDCLDSILYTKLYWFFKRALENDVKSRCLIYI